MGHSSHRIAIGIDIGGTGIKGASVDLDSGELISERIKIATPEGGHPDAIIEVVAEIVSRIGGPGADSAPLGVTFPAIIRDGHTMSAANVSREWIGLDARSLFGRALGREITFVNDADAAGFAESEFGAAKGRNGLSLVTTLGTGIGAGAIYNGVLIPNFELGHLEIDGHDAESRAAFSAKEREGLGWEEWAARLQRFYEVLEFLFSPDLLIVGGGVSKSHEHFLPLLRLDTPIVPAVHRNNAGILGAAAFAAGA
ncbi:polyphosphate--glucose phosphotransferase [Mycetocola spongiae]|uniref:polyphosphate--glucose phosphotransferase n=1 Tax=Mycetocola spongiae TaxID=2859226 RepID=UPI001CF20D2E|nr:ROK family protein [Mycetocola spongiae]UCR89491.1 ROK family protein [Mycetocola spongiae]